MKADVRRKEIVNYMLQHSTAISGGELSKNVRHVSIDLSSHSPIKLIFGYFALRSLVLKEKFNLIHAHARLPALIASLISKEFKIPCAHFIF